MLLAGGRNKGLDLTAMAGAPERMRAVVAIGEAAPEVEAAFAGICPVTTATSMDDAVRAAREVAVAGRRRAAVARLRQLRLVPGATPSAATTSPVPFEHWRRT